MSPTNCIKLCQIKKAGYVNRPIIVTVGNKEEVKRNDSAKGFVCKFTLKDGKSRITALAFNANGKRLYDELQTESKYKISGSIVAKKRDPKFKKVPVDSTSKFDLHLNNNVVITLISAPKRTTRNVQSATVQDDVEGVILRIRHQKPGPAGELQNCTLEGGRLYRYMGCEVCSKKIILADKKDGQFYCTVCKKKSGDKQRKICMVINDIKIKHDATGKIIPDVVCFNNDANALLEKTASDFTDDIEAITLYLNAISSKRFNVALCINKIGSVVTLKVHKITVAGSPTPSGTQAEASGSSSRVISGTPQGCTISDVDVSTELKMVIIKRPSLPRLATAHEYNLNSSCPGMVLIVNNREFKNNDDDTRFGAEKDEANLTSLFRQLNFGVRKFRDVQDKAELDKIIDNFKRDVVSNKASSIFVFVMSHGKNMEVMLSGSLPVLEENGQVVPVPNHVNFFDDIVNQFSEQNFPDFIGFPKILFDCSCKSFDRTDYVGDLRAQRAFFTDTYICHAAMPGRVACRYEGIGTWFIRTLVEVWMNNAYNTELQGLMKMVQKSLQDFGRSTGDGDYTQICLPIPILFDDFYLPVVPEGHESLNGKNTEYEQDYNTQNAPTQVMGYYGQ